jgi:3-hydroxybutyryl-CoA dehydrogenase
MGPFELLDLTGLDVSVPVMESIHAQYYGDDRYRPAALARSRMAAGLLGRKSMQGFYRYESGEALKVRPRLAKPSGPTDVCAWWPSSGRGALPQRVLDLLRDVRKSADPTRADVVLVAPLGEDLSSAIHDMWLDPSKAVGVDPLFSGPHGVTLMRSPASTIRAVDAASCIFAAQNIPAYVVCDSPGFVAPRVIACIVNLACEMAQQGIALPADLDAAARLGLGYPVGPFEWGDRIGAKHILDVLKGLHATFGDQRYRPAPWLVRRARLGLPLSTPDADLITTH